MQEGDSPRLAALLIAIVAPLVSPPVLAQVPNGAGWSLQVVRLEIGSELQHPRLVWLGVTNRDRDVRLVCLDGWSYRTVASVMPMIAAGEASPHSCGTLETFHLIQGGQTAYLSVMLPDNELKASTLIQFTATLVTYDLPSKKRDRPTETQWTGTLADAAEAGRRLFQK